MFADVFFASLGQGRTSRGGFGARLQSGILLSEEGIYCMDNCTPVSGAFQKPPNCPKRGSVSEAFIHEGKRHERSCPDIG